MGTAARALGAGELYLTSVCSGGHDEWLTNSGISSKDILRQPSTFLLSLRRGWAESKILFAAKEAWGIGGFAAGCHVRIQGPHQGSASLLPIHAAEIDLI